MLHFIFYCFVKLNEINSPILIYKQLNLLIGWLLRTSISTCSEIADESEINFHSISVTLPTIYENQKSDNPNWTTHFINVSRGGRLPLENETIEKLSYLMSE